MPVTAKLHRATLALAAALLALPGWAAGPAAPDAEARYQQDRARCAGGQSGQAQETCLEEAGAVLEEGRRGSLGTTSAGDLERNATRRCEAQPLADRAACVQRILGGSSEGSVGGGGLIRQTETPVR